MAVFNSFTFDGINSLDYGIYITGEAVYNAPERVVEMVSVPGRNGNIAIDQGRFENIEVTYPAGCFADSQADFADKVMRFRNALASRYTYKRLTDEYHSDEYRLGLYKSGLDVDAVRYGTAGQFDITFDCKPQRFLLSGETAVTPSDYGNPQTETGEIVTIDSDGSLGVKSLEVSLSPIQSLNGYDKPWVGGAGKNKIPFPYADNRTEIAGVPVTTHDDGTITFNGTPSGGTMFFNLTTESANPITLEAGTYTLSNGGIIGNLCRITAVKDGSYFTTTDSSSGKTTFTIKEQGVFSFYISTPNGTAMNNITVKPMLEEGSTATSYAPYSNICPISGHTECVTEVCGKNLFDESIFATLSGWTETDGTYTGKSSQFVNSFVVLSDVPAETQVTISFEGIVNGSTLRAGYVWIDYTDGTHSYLAFIGNTWNSYELTSTASKSVAQIRFADSNGLSISIRKAQIELGSTATDYEPYNGTTHTTALGQTVYGGTLDVVSGELVVDRAMVDLGSLNWTLSGGFFRTNDLMSTVKKPINNQTMVNAISSAYPIMTWTAISTTDTAIAVDTTGRMIVANPSITNVSDFVTAMNGVQLCYELAEPQTYQLTPQQVTLLVGENHLFSDGEIMVEYGTHPYYNPTQFESKPLIVVTGKGVLQIGDYVLNIVGRENQTIYIDCESQEAWEVVGAGRISRNDYIQNAGEEFPVLVPGINNISLGSGITAVTITPRWWRI